MPGKVNPVIPEAVSQAALKVFGDDAALTTAAALGSLELNAFMPLIAACLLESAELLARACDILRRHCVDGIEADEARCRDHVDSSTAAATALLAVMSYDAAPALAAKAKREGRPLRDTAVESGAVTAEQFDQLVSPEAVCRLGSK